MDRETDEWKAREVARLLGLVEAERRQYQEIVAAIPVGLLILDSDLTVVSANGEARRLLGSQTRIALPDFIEDKVRQSIADGGSHSNLSMSAAERGLRVSIRRIEASEEKPRFEALVMIEENGGRRAHAEETDDEGLPAAELLDSVDATVWAVDLATKRFLYVSEKGQELLGFPVERWMDTADFWSGRIHPEDRSWVLEAYEGSIRNWSRHSCEFRAISSYGKIVWLRETARLLQDPEGQTRHLIGFTVDVTERRLLDAQFAQAQRQDAIRGWAHRISREIGSQIDAISGSDPRRVAGAVDRLRTLADQLGTLGAVEARAGTGVDVIDLLNRIAPTMQTVLGGRVDLEMRLFPGSIGVNADARQLEEVLGILVRRAGQNVAGTGVVRVDCGRAEIGEMLDASRSTLKPGAYAVITIGDDGKTLDGESRLAFFDGLPTPNGSDGLDRDLARAYSLVRTWEGDISVTSSHPEGNLVQVFLPRESIRMELTTTAVAERSAPPPAGPPPPGPPGPQHILVVDDEAGIRRLVYRMLKRQSYEVIEAVDLASALLVSDMHPNRIDLLIADVMTPEMASSHTIERFRKSSPRMRLLYLSSDVSESDSLLRNLPPGAASLQKPFTLGSLISKVKDVLK